MRSQTRSEIIDAVASSDRPITRSQIADSLNRKKTPHLIGVIEELVEQGYLERTQRVFHNGVVGYAYTLRNR